MTIGHDGRNAEWWPDGAGCDTTLTLLLSTHRMPPLAAPVLSGQGDSSLSAD